MKLEKWALISEVFASLAIVATLLVLIVESRSNTEAIKASTYQAVVDSVTRTLDLRVSDPEITRIWDSGMAGADLDEIDRSRFSAMLLGAIRRFENAFYQFQLGTIDEQQWRILRDQARNVVAAPGGQLWWEQSRHSFSPAFQQQLEATSQ